MAQPKDYGTRLRSAYEQLSTSAQSLNNASDELGKLAASFEASLRKLNLGVVAWVNFDTWGDDNDPSRSYAYQVGWTKISGGKWSLAISEVAYNENDGTQETLGYWPFSEAQRELRIQAVEKFPELLERLEKGVRDLDALVQAKLGKARSLIEILDGSIEEAESKEVQQ